MRLRKIPAFIQARLYRPHPTLAVLGALLLVGIGLRAWLVYQYAPGFVGYDDSRGYLATLIAPNLYWQPVRPAGYPIFLLLARDLSSHLRSTVVLQHALGVATAILLYLAVARVTRRRWVALLPAAVILLGGSQIYLEHAIVTESVFAFLVALALWLAVLSISSSRRPLWLIPAGAAIGAAITLRSVGFTLVPALLVWAVLARSASMRMRIAAPLAVVAGVVLTLGPYLLHQHSKTDSWGLTRTTGWTLAARMSTFADCSNLPPRRARKPCATTRSRNRSVRTRPPTNSTRRSHPPSRRLDLPPRTTKLWIPQVLNSNRMVCNGGSRLPSCGISSVRT